ncbi:unnamed protein product [Phytophthora lilii]|uniref:Sugar transporter SWEET1 n=1 Tax=Phytophthora lilii TaxID=2077276 RepID=A0A9W6X4W4_9STRA|nr:unnamed protein product [Phytophthora lilii]
MTDQPDLKFDQAKVITHEISLCAILNFESKSARVYLEVKNDAINFYAVAVTIAKVVTMITTIMMRISLFPDWNRWRKNDSTGDVYAVFRPDLHYSHAALFYAYAIDDFIPLFATSVLGALIGIFMAYYFYRWSEDKRDAIRTFIVFFLVCLAITIYAVIAITGLTKQSSSSVGTTLGFITIGTTTLMYALSMATILRVIHQDGDIDAVHYGCGERLKQLLLGRLRRTREQHVSAGPEHRRSFLECHSGDCHLHLQEQGATRWTVGLDIAKQTQISSPSGLPALNTRTRGGRRDEAPGNTDRNENNQRVLREILASRHHNLVLPSFSSLASQCLGRCKNMAKCDQSSGMMRCASLVEVRVKSKVSLRIQTGTSRIQQIIAVMSGSDTAILVFKIITIVTTIFMRISLMPDFQRMRKMKSTGDMSVLPCVLLYANCYLLCWYSYAVDNIIPLFLTAALGVVAGVFFAFFFYRWTAHKRDVMKIFVILAMIMLLETIYGAIAFLGWTGQDRSSTGTTLGVLVIISSVGLYASPMATIRHVIRTKTSSSMPFTMGVVNVINSFCWVVYAILVDDVFILVPNASGALLGSIQLILTFIYPRKAPSEGQIISTRINDPRAGPVNSACGEQASLSVVIHSPAQEGREYRKSGALEGPNFIAIRSPTA